MDYDDQTEKFALHWAVQNGDLHKVVRLLGLGVDHNQVDEDSIAPLTYAAKAGFLNNKNSVR